ncbi:MAG: IS66 family transposase, partial [Acidimicrobiia bacterium]
TLKEQLAKAKKDSSTSSKPPSSDIVNPNKKTGKGRRGKRKPGGQPGHPKHKRPEFPPELLDGIWEYQLSECPVCGDALLPSDEAPRVVQQIEIIQKPIRIDEHRGMAYWCESCQQVHYAPLPTEVQKGGLFGPQLTALVAYMKGTCHASFSTIRKFLRDVLKVTVSRGYLRKLIAKVTDSLDHAYEELLSLLPGEAVVNVDETGHKEKGRRLWTWCFRAELYTLFRIDTSRGSQVIIDTLGEEFDGVLGCDYFSAYRKYMDTFDVRVQFCIAHLIRDVKFLLTLPDRRTQNYGKRLRDAIRRMFEVIHRRDELKPAMFARRLAAARDVVIAKATKHVPPSKKAKNMAKRFLERGQAYFEFITTPNVEPTNNLAEQAIRFVVIDRRITQGTRGESGRRWCERIWTTLATCDRTGREVLDFLHQTLLAHWHGFAPPSLLETGFP